MERVGLSKGVIAGAILMFCGLFGTGADAGSGTNGDVAMFRGDLSHTGYLDTQGVEEFHGVKWKFETKGKVWSTPVIQGDTLYIGSTDKVFYAINTKTGQAEWQYAAGGEVRSTAALDSGNLYFQSSDGFLHSLKASDGSELWHFKMDGPDTKRHDYDFWQSSPMVSKGVVYLGGGNSTFYAVNAGDGSLKWKIPLPEYKTKKGIGFIPTLHASPAIADGIVYFAAGGFEPKTQVTPGSVYAVSAETGEQVWANEKLQAVVASPVICGDKLIIGGEVGGMVALDLKTGKRVWGQGVSPFVFASPALSKDTIFSGSSDEHIFFAVNALTGKVKWKVKVPEAAHASPAVVGNTVYYACYNNYSPENVGFVYAADTETGKERWHYKTGGNILSSPVVSDGVLYIGSDDGCIYAIY